MVDLPFKEGGVFQKHSARNSISKVGMLPKRLLKRNTFVALRTKTVEIKVWVAGSPANPVADFDMTGFYRSWHGCIVAGQSDESSQTHCCG